MTFILDYANRRLLIGDINGYKQILTRVCLRQTIRLIDQKWGYPVFIKPVDSGSSFGVSRVDKPNQVRSAVKQARKFSQIIMIEQAVLGDELMVSFVENKVLPPILIKPKKAKFFDYTSKYTLQGAEEICPAPVSTSLGNKLKRLTLKIKKAVGVETYGRVDYVLDKQTHQIYTLEINTVPGMTKTSLIPKAARAYGWRSGQLLDNIINESLAKFKKL